MVAKPGGLGLCTPCQALLASWTLILQEQQHQRLALAAMGIQRRSGLVKSGRHQYGGGAAKRLEQFGL